MVTFTIGCILDHSQICVPGIIKARSIKENAKYVCPLCNQCAYYLYKIKRHLNSHIGYKPFQCDVCQKRFSNKFGLQRHSLEIHSIIIDKRAIFGSHDYNNRNNFICGAIFDSVHEAGLASISVGTDDKPDMMCEDEEDLDDDKELAIPEHLRADMPMRCLDEDGKEDANKVNEPDLDSAGVEKEKVNGPDLDSAGVEKETAGEETPGGKNAEETPGEKSAEETTGEKRAEETIGEKSAEEDRQENEGRQRRSHR
uniref:Zinc finger and BTB domain-containing protein 46 n=1 Tax=Cacopsylla melanoneura TaxID=428564 RepID=A0A8D8WKX2_9HEMI